MTKPRAISIVLAGDVVLDEPDPDHWLSGIAGALQSADLAIGHLEVPHTGRGTELPGDVPAPGADPAAIDALARAGFDIMTLAGNHIADQGPAGIDDTVHGLQAAGIGHCGAGMDIESARHPAMVEVDGSEVAVLSYNCVGPESGWAAAGRPGCAYLPVKTADGGPVTPIAELVGVDEEAEHILKTDIGAVREQADLVIVALHKGIVHTPVVLAPYEVPLGHLVIDSGADVVVGHHAHIVRGIEIYRGKPIFHGLGNGCVVTSALSPDQDHPGRAEWARRRRELFGFEPDPEYELAPFHPEAVNAMLGTVSWTPGGGMGCGIVPVTVDPPGRPVTAAGERASEVVQYVERITRGANLQDIRFVEQQEGWFAET